MSCRVTGDAKNLQPDSLQVSGAAPEVAFCRKPRLTTLRGVRREFGALYLDLLHGRVPQKVAGTAGGLLNGIVKALEAELLEARLAALEERAGIKAPRKHSMQMPRLIGHA